MIQLYGTSPQKYHRIGKAPGNREFASFLQCRGGFRCQNRIVIVAYQLAAVGYAVGMAAQIFHGLRPGCHGLEIVGFSAPLDACDTVIGGKGWQSKNCRCEDVEEQNPTFHSIPLNSAGPAAAGSRVLKSRLAATGAYSCPRE